MAKGKKEREKKEISVIEKILSKKDIIVNIGGGLVVSYPIVNTICNLFHQSDCEKFYGLPGKYFHSDINDRLLYLGCIIAFLIACIAPLILKKYNEKNGDFSRGFIIYNFVYVLIVGLALGIINVYNLIEIMKQAYKTNGIFRYVNYILNQNADITVFVVVVLGVLTLLGIIFMDKIRSIKWEKIKKVVGIVFSVSVALSIMLMIYGTIFKMCITIKDKTKYEFLTTDDKEYVVLSEYEDRVLIVPYEVKKSGQYIFKTDQYFFCDKYEGKYKYIDLKNTPLVNKDD